MQICPNCAYNNRPGVVFCENCGTSLIGSQATADTKSLDKNEPVAGVDTKIEVEEIKDAGVLGSEVFPPHATLRIEINDGAYVLKFNPQDKDIILFGRTDPSTGVTPQVDLTPYAGYRMGVSRRHAEIRKSSAQDNTLELWDLGSSNGTFLNGERLISHRPYVLSDGDEIQLGQLRVRAFFQKSVTKALDPAQVEGLGKPTETPASSAPEATVKMTAEAVREAIAELKKAENNVTVAIESASNPVEAQPSAPKPIMPVVPGKEISEAANPSSASELKQPENPPTTAAQPDPAKNEVEEKKPEPSTPTQPE